MAEAISLPRPVRIPLPGLGGIPGMVAQAAIKAAMQDAVRASEGVRIGKCADGKAFGSNVDCQQCHPVNGQKWTPVNRNITDANRINYDYQLFIANLNAGPQHFSWAGGFPEEWMYKAVEFDGFWESQCTLVEAKGRYKQFLGSNGKVPKHFKHIFDDFIFQGMRQLNAAMPLPPAWLKWHCMEPEVVAFVLNLFFSAGLPIIVLHTPFA